MSYPEESASLATIPWRTEPMVLVCYPQHPLAKRRSVTLEACCATNRSWHFKTGLKIREEIDRALAAEQSFAFAWRWSSTTSKRSSGRSKSAPASACCRSRRSLARSMPARLVQIPHRGHHARAAAGHHSSPRPQAERNGPAVYPVACNRKRAPLAEAGRCRCSSLPRESNGHPADEQTRGVECCVVTQLPFARVGCHG